MSIDEQNVIDSICERIRTLVSKARQFKESPSVEPSLYTTQFLNDAQVLESIENLATRLLEDVDLGEEAAKRVKQSRSTAVEHAARALFYEYLGTYSITDSNFSDVWNLLDILHLSAEYEQCESSLALWLIEELLDSQTIDGCRRIFDYLESRRERMITQSWDKNKSLILLRSCNELLRRLSRTEDAVFCGRVFIFLFQSFPLGDKSAVNLRGEFHTENVTNYDDIPSKNLQTEASQHIQPMDVDEKPTLNGDATTQKSGAQPNQKSAIGSETKLEDTGNTAHRVKPGKGQSDEADLDAFYAHFWSLQQVFSNPISLFPEAQQRPSDKEMKLYDFGEFQRGLELSLKKFKEAPKIVQTQPGSRHSNDASIGPSSPPKGIKRKRNSLSDTQMSSSSQTTTALDTALLNGFNPKYLTSRDLFALELSDLTFQRHILVQSLIILDFLLSFTPRAKSKFARLKPQKAMVYNFTLSDEQATWCHKMRASVAAYLQGEGTNAGGPDGKFYYRMVSSVLSRDKNWVRWKAESCPSISLPPASADSYLEAKSGAKRAATTRRLKAQPMGAMDLSFLRDDPDESDETRSFRRLRESSSIDQPDTSTYVREIENMDLDIDFEKENKDKADKLELEAEKDKAQGKVTAAQLDEARRKAGELRAAWQQQVESRATQSWRVLRMTAKRRLSLFDKINEAPGGNITKVMQAVQNAEGEAEAMEEHVEDPGVEKALGDEPNSDSVAPEAPASNEEDPQIKSSSAQQAGDEGVVAEETQEGEPQTMELDPEPEIEQEMSAAQEELQDSALNVDEMPIADGLDTPVPAGINGDVSMQEDVGSVQQENESGEEREEGEESTGELNESGEEERQSGAEDI